MSDSNTDNTYTEMPSTSNDMHLHRLQRQQWVQRGHVQRRSFRFPASELQYSLVV